MQQSQQHEDERANLHFDEILKEKLLEFKVVNVSMLQAMKTLRAGRSNRRQPRRRAATAARARSELRRRSDVPESDPTSGTAGAMRRIQQKVQPASRKKRLQ